MTMRPTNQWDFQVVKGKYGWFFIQDLTDGCLMTEADAEITAFHTHKEALQWITDNAATFGETNAPRFHSLAEAREWCSKLFPDDELKGWAAGSKA